MPPDSPIHQTTEAIGRRFEELSSVRDRALGEGRQLIRLAANSIRATHRGELEPAEELLTEGAGPAVDVSARAPTLSHHLLGRGTSRTR